MWCSEITTITCPTDIPTRGNNREEFGGSLRSHWQIEIKMKLLVWSVFSYLCQDRGSSNTSRCKGGMGERTTTTAQLWTLPAWTAQHPRAPPGAEARAAPVSLDLKLHQRTANPLWTTGTKSLEPQRRRTVTCKEWGVSKATPARIHPCACSGLALLSPAHTRTTTSQWNSDWMRAPGAKFLFSFYFLRIQLSATCWLAQPLLSSKQMQFFTKKDNSQVEFPLLSFSIRREN